MDFVKNLSREVQVVLGGAVLYLIFSFLDWQQRSFAFVGTVGLNEWHGVGIIAGLLVIALLVWEAARFFDAKIPLGTLSEGLVSVALALLLALFTVITFFNHSTARHWPAWVGLILSLVIAAAAVVRARDEGVELPETRRTSGTQETAPTPPAEPSVEAPAVPDE